MTARRAYLGTLAIMPAVTAPCLLWRSRLATVDVAMVLLLGVVVVSARYPRGPAVLASLLSIAALAGRPDIGLAAVAIWTLLCLAFHSVRIVQAFAARAAGRTVMPFLADA